jgi:hypothetical protein
MHWAVLQGVAWTSMFINNLRMDSITAAMEKTFDGEHPCPLCLAIKEGKKDKKDDSKPNVTSPAQKFLAVLLPNQQLITPSCTEIQIFANAVFQYKKRFDKPTIPPPRIHNIII